MKKVLFFKKFAFVSVVSALFVSILSCGENSGLGASVDTEAPKLEISYPLSSSVIREDFILAGTCTDDKGVSSVVVTVYPSGSSEPLETKKATITKDSWEISLNEKDDEASASNAWGLPVYKWADGKYDIQVVAYDDAGHSSGKNSRTVEIDNTPPLFFITSPQVDDVSDSEITNYGTRLKISGTIADEHKVKTMSVVVYDEAGNIVADSETNPITVNNVTTAGGTSETIARFLDTDLSGDTLNTQYIDIYFAGDADKNRTGDRKFSCKITLTDEAEVYRNPPSDSPTRAVTDATAISAGNSSSRLYAYYNIREIVGADDFDANTMMQIINGTYSGSAETKGILEAALLKEGNSQETAQFTLNPKANPQYNAIGFAISANETDESKSWAESTRQASLSVVAQMGLNQTPLTKNSARTYLFGPIDGTYKYTKSDGGEANREILVDFVTNERAKLNKLYGLMEELSDEYREKYDSEKKIIEDEDEIFENFKKTNAELLQSFTDSDIYFKKLEPTSTATGSGETYTYPYQVPEELPIAGKEYLVLVTGWDQDGLSFSNGSNYYGFKFTVSSNAPTFSGVNFLINGTTDTITVDSYTNKGALTIQGSARSDSNNISKVVYAFNLADEAASDDNTHVAGFDYSSDSDNGEYVIKGENEFDGTKSSEEFQFNLIEKLTDAQKTLLSAKGHRYLYSVRLTVYDTMNKTGTAQYIVHVDTKDPGIEFTSAKTVYTDSEGKNWIGTSGLSSLKGSIDEENPKDVSYFISKNGVQVGDTVSLGPKYSFELKSDSFSGISLVQGDKIKVVVIAKDKADNSAQKESEEYLVDATAPLLFVNDDRSGDNAPKKIRINNKEYTEPTDSDKTWLNDTALTFEGWYEEANSGINAVHYVVNPSAVPTTGEAVKSAEGKGAMGATASSDSSYKNYSKFSSIISGFNPSGESTVYLAAEDNVGNISSISGYKIYIDQAGPSFDPVPEEKRNLPANGTQDISFEITVKDQEGASGLTKSSDSQLENLVIVAIANGNAYKLSEVENSFTHTYDKSTGVLKGTIKKEYISAESHEGATSSVGTLNEKFDGNVTLQITVVDNAGNSSQNQQFVLQVDSSAPKVKVTVPAAVSASETNYKNISWITGKTTIQGTVTDVGVSGVDSSEFKFLIPTKAQQKAISDLGANATDAQRVEALSGADWNGSFTENDGVTWSIAYDSSYLEEAKRNGKNSFVYYGAAGGENPTYATVFSAPSTTRYRTVPIYFLVTDKAGNKNVITDNKFYIDIEGGKPKISISYPKDKTDSAGAVSSWAKLSEEVALQGTAQDNEAVTKVELIELWYATADAGSLFTKYKAVTDPSAATDTNDWTRAIAGDVDLISVADVEHKKSSSGDLTIEQTVTGTSVVEPFDIEFNLTPLAEKLKESAKKITAIKAIVAVQDENDYDYKAVRYAFIDTETPTLSNEKIVKLDKALADGVTKITSIENGTLTAGDESYTVLVERKYEADMWLSGANDAHWYYVATVKDDSTIESVNLSAQSGITFAKDISVASTDLVSEDGGYVSYTFAIPIPTSADGNMYSKLTRNDGAHKDVNSYISLSIDNTAPQLRNTSENFVASPISTPIDNLKLVSSGNLGEKYVIENSNGSFSFGDQVQEKGSGLAFIGFWIERNSKKIVYNPVVKAGSDNTYKSGINDSQKVSAVYGEAKENGKVYLNSDKFPALYVTGASVSTETIDDSKYTAVTYSSLSENDFINRAYGMVKINGSYYKVKKVDENKVILDSNLELTATTINVEFIYANFIDHSGVETYELSSDGTTYTVSNDDDIDNSKGDGIAESLVLKSGVYSWTAEFDSNNMPDGPARINVVAMDNAGNLSYSYVDTSIQNNRPRIAKVFLATDLNGNEKFDFYSDSDGFGTKIESGNAKYDSKNPNKYDLDSLTVENGTELGEFMFFSTLDEDGNSTALATVKDKGVNNNFIVMDKFLILPEIVGGNTNNGKDPLKYTYNVVDSAAAVTTTKSSTDLGEFVTGTNLTDLLKKKDGSTFDVDVLPLKGIYFERNNAEATEPTLGTKDALDTYESWTQTGTSVTKTTKFFGFTIWDATGTDDDTITQGENTLWALLSVPVVVNVHDDIKPTPTITPFYWNSKDDSSTVYDEDDQPLGHIDYLDSDNKVMEKPGVAGQIYLEGVAKDDSRVEEIYITDPSGTETLAAKRDGGTWKTTASDLNTTWPTNWKSFEIMREEEPTQKGNSVYWRLKIDASKYGVASDKVFTVSAKDKSDNKSTAGTTQTKDPKQTGTTTDVNTDYYKMDFVPYIKSITLEDGTSLRSRLGRYSVRAGENISIEGMNFGESGTATVHFYKSATDGSQGDEVESEQITGAIIKDNSVTVKAPSYSRYVAVTVSDKTTQNNSNSNLSGHNIEEGYVAPKAGAKVSSTNDIGGKKASENGTNFWTDDRYLSVWNVPNASLFNGSINPHSGVIKKISDKNSGSLTGNNVSGTQTGSSSSADDVGGQAFYNQNGTNSSLNLTQGQHDRYFAALSSDDIKVYGYLSSQMSGNSINWNNVITSASEAMGYAPGIDQMDYTTVNGLPYYVMQDNYLGGDSASVWGPGLFLTREGMSFRSDKFQGDNTIEESKCYFIIERQGDSYPAAKRSADTAKTGYDLVLYQFKNPRIAGAQVTNEKMNYSNANGTNYVTGVDYIYVSYYDSYARCLKYAGYKVGHRIYKDALIDMYQWGQNNYRTDIVPMMHSAKHEAENNNHGKGGDNNSVVETSHMTDGATTVAGYDTTVLSPTSFDEEAGEWSDIMVDSTGETPIPVIIYYNKTEKCIEIARGTVSFPSNNRIKTATGKTGADAQWKKSQIKPKGTSNYFGQYVSAAMDEAGNIHAAAVDAGKGRVYYLYIVKSSDSYSISSYSILGTVNACWTDIELTNGGIKTQFKSVGSTTKTKDVKPVISWVDKAELNATDGVKVSYLAPDDTDGTKWETTTDPAIFAVNDQRTSVMADVYEGTGTEKSPVAVGFNSDMLALDFLRGE